MKALNQNLLSSKREKHLKLSQRFLKLLKSGSFKRLSRRKQYRIVERIKKIERQLKDYQLSGREALNINFKHWAVALALGVVSYTSSAQEKPKKLQNKNPFGIERERDHEALRNNYLRYAGSSESSKMAFGFDLATTLGTPAVDNAVTGDFDGDGDVDAIYRPEGMITSYTLRNDGNFTFQQLEKEMPLLLNNPHADDFDNDGDIDILIDASSYGYDSIVVMLNDGSGNFNATGEPFAINADSYYSKISDFDGDGDLDIVSNNWNGYLKVGLGDGAGNFTAGGNIDSVQMLLGTGDFDNDGDVDLLVNEVYQYDSGYGTWEQTRYTILRNDGSGNFISDEVAIFNPDFSQTRVFIQDLNGDGFDDILSSIQVWDPETQTYSKRIDVFFNNGEGSFSSTQDFSIPVQNYFFEAQFVDLDGDTDIDILSNTYENFGAYSLINNGDETFTENTLPVSAGARAVDDFDNDGDIDLLSFSSFNADSWRNDGDLQFTLMQQDIIELATSASLDILDLNGDGAAEVLQFGASKVWQNSGDSRNFTVSQRFESFDIDHKLVDIDDDGDMDIVTAVYSQMNHVGNVLRNDNGTFVVSDSLGFEGADEGYRIAIGDIDLDGDSDIAILADMYSANYNTDSQTIIFFDNNGSGNFSYLSSHEVASDTEFQDFDLADIDGDGDLDITGISYTSTYENSGLVIGRNDGTGVFSFEDVITASGSNDFERMAIADFDDDSDLDIFLLNNGGGYSYLFVNDGTGGFSYQATNIIIDDEGMVVAGDMDNDGDTDLVLAIGAEYEDSYSSIKKIFLNDGSGTFTDSNITMQSQGYYAYALNVGDIDGDADLDIVVGGIYFPTELWINSLNTVNQLELDKQALISLHTNMGGDDWSDNTNWNSEEDVSSWYGVEVSNGRVTGLDLSNNNLSGEVTNALINLSALQNLDLSGNNITSIPDLSGIETLTSADVSENSLDFADLEPNADVPFLVYSPQSVIGEHEVINSPVNSMVTLSEDVGGVSNTYQWYFHDQLLEGEVNEQLMITDLSADDMGEYYVEISNTTLPDLTLVSVPDLVNATAALSGLLADIEGDIVSAAEVILLQVTNNNGFDTVATVSPNIDGFYTFPDVVLSMYQVIADPDLQVNPDLLPTYYPSNIFWEEADTINLTTNITNADIAVSIFVEEPLGGSGEISGELYEEVPDGGRILAKKRIANAGVTIRRGRNSGRKGSDTKSKMLEEFDLVAHLKTDENGQFIFDELTKGTYRLNIQYPGYPMDENSFIDISIGDVDGGSVADNNKVQVEAEVKEGEIVVRNVTVLSIQDDKLLSDIHLFPNPSKGLIQIKMNATVGELNATLYDMKGKMIYQKQIKEENDEQIDLTDIPNGTYILKLNSLGSDNFSEWSFKIILE